MAIRPEQPDSLIGSLQAEVADEASPMLRFLVEHVRLIVLVILLFVAAIIGYWVWSWQEDKSRSSEMLELGRILVIPDDKARLDALETFVPNAPTSARNSAWVAILESASRLGDTDKVYDAWRAIAEFDPSIKPNAVMAMATISAERGAYDQALSLLDGIAANLNQADVANVNMRIALLSEMLGNHERAITACDQVINNPGVLTDLRFWTQKRADLEQKIKARRSENPPTE